MASEVEALALPAHEFHQRNGLDAWLYVDGHGSYVLAFAGTASLLDIVVDVRHAFGAVTSQYEAAGVLSQRVHAACPHMVMTGHSLGGALASLGAPSIPTSRFGASSATRARCTRWSVVCSRPSSSARSRSGR